MNSRDVKRDIQELIAAHNVKFLRLQFSDILGVNKNVTIPIEQVDRALAGEIMFDGSAIEGFVRIEESDMLLKPDPDTFAILPWKSNGSGSTARLICDVYKTCGTPFEGCPRFVLKKVLEEAAQLGYTCHAGPEAEFFLFAKGKGPRPLTDDKGGYFDLSPVDSGDDARQDMVQTLQGMGFEIESSHHENSPGQHEIDFKYSDMLKTADNVMTFKYVVKVIAARHNLHATFIPKPIFGVNGSGMHVHISLIKDERNVFYAPDNEMHLSDVARYFIGGLMKHARGYTAVTNPLVNSYKRLVPGYEAPAYIAWSRKNRSPLIRIPGVRGQESRIEHRLPDPSCNPYLAFAVILKAGLDGIKQKTFPPDPVNDNIYNMSSKERANKGVDDLPSNLHQALIELSNNELIRSTLGSHIYQRFWEAKLIEWKVYSTQVHPWELEQYMEIF